MASEHLTEKVRRLRVRQLFEARPSDERTETSMLIFFWRLMKYHPELLPQGKHGDPYQHLKSDLHGLHALDGKNH